MEKSEEIGELAKALAAAQGEIGNVLKSKSNPFFKSSYADLAACWDAARGPLSKHGLSVLQLPVPCEGNSVALETVLAHSSGQWISSTSAMPVSKGDAQGHGSALTYLRRYALCAVIGLAQEDDDGNAASAKETQKPVEKPARQPVPQARPKTETKKKDEWHREEFAGIVVVLDKAKGYFEIDAEPATRFFVSKTYMQEFGGVNAGDRVSFEGYYNKSNEKLIWRGRHFHVTPATIAPGSPDDDVPELDDMKKLEKEFDEVFGSAEE